MKMRTVRWAIGAILAIGAAAANAEDFNITVPINVSSLPPNINGMLLACLVYTNEPRLGGRNIGIGRSRIDLAGNYRGETTVRFNASAGQDPGSATHYECSGSFVGDERGTTVHYYANLAGSVEFPRAPGSAFALKTGVRPMPR